jgi:hypothetical protein
MVTPPFISDEVISATLDMLNAASPLEAAARQGRSGRFQPELTGFVAAFTLEQRPDAAGIGLFIMLVLYEAFRANAVKVHKARERVVLRHWRAAREHADALRLDMDNPMELLDDIPESSEPAALQYVIEALTEVTDDGVQLTDDEFWHLYAVLRAAIETLHEVATVPRPA